MSSRSDKALKAQKDKHHAILRELVQEVPNKTCADCLAKGPRWASWNLGVFVCIRCAGIHRNLGVHISKVKSIDLDSWTQEQLEHFLKWGNARAALYYECYLPKDFARPQGNQAVETFIRNKYEKKLYQKKDGEPEPNTDTRLQDRMKGNTTEKENKPPSRRKPEVKEEPKTAEKTILDISKNAPAEIKAPAVEDTSRLAAAASQPKSNSMNDLVSLEPATAAPNEPVTKPCASTDDLLNFGAFSDPVPLCQPDPFVASGGSAAPTETPVVNGNSGVTADSAPAEPAKSTKESILSLYASGATSQQKMYGVPGGVYMQPQQMSQQQMPQQQMQMSQQMPQQMPYSYHSQQQQAMPNQMQQMNAQMHQMALNQPNQMMTSQQTFSQQQMSQFAATAQPSATSAASGFATPMYTSNASSQMNNMFQQQQQQQQQSMIATPGNYGNGMGQNMNMQGMNAGQNMQGMNAGWGGGPAMMNGMNMQQQQLLQQQQLRQQQQRQQQQQFGGGGGQFNMSASGGSTGGSMLNGHAGYTMNNQLWN